MGKRAAVAVVLAVLVAGCGGPGEPVPTVVVPAGPGEPARVLPGDEAAERRAPVPISPADVAYVQDMIPHHEQAVRMAALAPGRAADPRVAAIAARIAAAQPPEIAAMRAWLDRSEGVVDHGAGGGTHAPGGHDMPGMAGPAQLAELEAATGEAFDALFLQLMTAHHRGALIMAEELATAGTDILVSEMAQGVIVTQTAEIDRMADIAAT